MFWTRNRSFPARATLRDQLDLFNRFIGAAGAGDVSSSFPAFNVWSNDDGAVIASELPGVKMEDLDITVSGKQVSVKGARKEDENPKGRYMRRERPSGEFNRTFEMPFRIDGAKVSAKLSHGILHVELPRAEIDKPKKIAVSAG